jgi:hypothetical protein
VGAPGGLVFYVSHFYWYSIICCERSILLHPNPLTFDHVGERGGPLGASFFTTSVIFIGILLFFVKEAFYSILTLLSLWSCRGPWGPLVASFFTSVIFIGILSFLKDSEEMETAQSDHRRNDDPSSIGLSSDAQFRCDSKPKVVSRWIEESIIKPYSD